MVTHEGKFTRFIYQRNIGIFRSNGKSFITCGNFTNVSLQEQVRLYGDFVQHPRYGEQFKVTNWEKVIPTTNEQLIKYLSSSIFKGIGKKKAEIIVQTYGEDTLQVIQEQGIHALTSLGIKEAVAENVVETIQTNGNLQKVLEQYQNFGVSPEILIRAYRSLQSDMKILLINPYELVNLSLLSFVRADEIAKKLGLSNISEYRIEACILRMVEYQCSLSGSCYIEETFLIDECQKVLKFEDAERALIVNVLESTRNIVIEEHRIYPKVLYAAEKNAAAKLSKMLYQRQNICSKQDIEKVIKEIQMESQSILTTEQKKAIYEMFQNNVLILTGGPGTGKTFTVRSMIQAFQKLFPFAKIALSAPTGRASRKLGEVTGFKQACTNHRLIGYQNNGIPTYHEGNPLPYDLVVVDEVSMLDMVMGSYVLNALKPSAKVVFVGDPDQLPSVGEGNVLQDMLTVGVPHVCLTEVFRQAKESQIIANAHRINHGQPLNINQEKNDYFYLESIEPQKIAALVQKSYQRFLKKGYSFADIMVLTPMRKGILGIENLNQLIQKTVNPFQTKAEELHIKDTVLRVGDKILYTRNNRDLDIYNGDMGIIESINIDQKEVVCDFHHRKVTLPKEEWKNIELAFVTSIHKAQGGESPIVIVVMSKLHHMMLYRSLLYTAQTRAEKIFVLIGEKEAVSTAINTSKKENRKTTFAQRISDIRRFQFQSYC